MQVKFRNNENFKNLVDEAVKVSSGTKVSEKDIKHLEEVTRQEDNTLSVKEKLFIQAVKENPKAIKSLNFIDSSKEFTLEVKKDPLQKHPHSTENDLSNTGNPLLSDIYDPGRERIWNDVNTSFTSAGIKMEKALKNLSGEDKQEISKAVGNFAGKILDNSDKKEGLAYINELVNFREAKLPKQDIIKALDKLSAMAETDYDYRAGDPKQVALSALHDIATPSNISQQMIGTCAGTSVQIQMAIREPLKYLDMIDTLAQNKPYKTEKGEEIKPNWTFTQEKEKHQNSNRTISSCIMQNAIMEFGRGSAYDSSDKTLKSGMGNSSSAHALESLLNKEMVTDEVMIDFRDPESSKQFISSINKARPSPANPIQISMAFSASGRDAHHAVNVIGIDDKKVRIINPWGREETFSLKKLEERITGVIVPGEKPKPVVTTPEDLNKYGEELKKRYPDLFNKK